MDYKRLNFWEYFIICSENYNKKETNLELAKYEEVFYKHHGHTHITNYQVRYDLNRHCIQVIFQQTACKSDWVANFEFSEKIYDSFSFNGKKLQMRVHRGWGDMWKACQDKVRSRIKSYLHMYPDSYIEVFGWSLGSGLAQIAAEDIYFKFNIKPYLYTFGSVKPFSGKKTYNYAKGCCAAAYNFYDHCDIVGYMVPWYKAINHIKIKAERFCIIKLFKPHTYHTLYDQENLYNNIK